MRCNEWFDPQIIKVVQLFSHPVWFIIRDEERPCTCKNPTSKVPDIHCEYCLGTGYQVQLTRVNASNQNRSNSIRGEMMGYNERNIVNVYYTEIETGIKEGDIIYDKYDLDVVSAVYHERSDASEIVYWRIETVPMKINSKAFEKHLKEFLKGAGYDV